MSPSIRESKMESDKPHTTDEKNHPDFSLAHDRTLVQNVQDHALIQEHTSRANKITTIVIDGSTTLAETPTATIISDDAVPQEQQPIYPTGWRFIFVTLGIMASVLVVALDNYIICTCL
jgi:hypothetical protein